MAIITSIGTPANTHATTGSVTGTWGTGQTRTAGNVLVAVVSAAASTSVTTIATASGWTSQAGIGNTGTAQVYVSVWTKTAAGADAVPTFTSTEAGTAGGMDCMLFELNGVNTTTPVDKTGTYASGASSGTLATMAANTTPQGASNYWEYGISIFAQEAAAASLTWVNTGVGGMATILNGNGATSVLQTSVCTVSSPVVGESLNNAGHFSTNTSAFGAGIVVVFLASSPLLPLVREVFTNNTAGVVTSGGITAPASGTSEAWTVTVSGAFPLAQKAVQPAIQFHVCDMAQPSEKMAVTVAPGGTGAGQSWTVTRGAEGTTPVAHLANFTIVEVTTAGALTGLESTDWYNVVTMFGADPTGATDCTAAINNAIAACAATGNGGTVYLPAGDYACTGAIIINSPYITLRGAGFGFATTLTYTPGTSRTAAIVVGLNSLVVQSNVVDLAINAGSAGAVQTGAGHGIVFRSNNGVIQNVIVQYANGDSFHLSLDSAINATNVYDVTMINCYGQYQAAIGLFIDQNYNSCEYYCVRLGGAVGGTGTYGISCLGNLQKFICCHAFFFATGGSLFGNGTLFPSGITIIDGEFETNNGAGINLNQMTNVQIVGANFYANTSSDISMGPQCANVEISDCYMGSPVQRFVYVSDCSTISIHDNIMNNTTAQFGVQVDTSAPVSTKIMIKNNLITSLAPGSSSFSVSLNAATFCDVSGNICSSGITEAGAANNNRIYGNMLAAGAVTLVGAASVAWFNQGATSTTTVQQSQYGITSAVTVSNTTTETSLVSMSVPANEPVPGAIYRFNSSGVLSTASSADVATINVRWGGTGGTSIMSLVSATSMPALTISMVTVPFLIEGEVDFRTATTCVGWLKFSWLNALVAAETTAASWQYGLTVVSTAVTVTVSAAEVLTLDWKWTSVGGSNTLVAETGTMERVA